MSQALQVEEEDGLALTVGELGDGSPDPGGELGEFCALVRAWLIRHPFRPHPVGRVNRPFGAPLTQPAPGHIQRDAAEPGAKSVRRTQPAQVG